MMRTTLKIDGMSCGHCIRSVEKALLGIDGVTVESVAVGGATVEHDPAVVSPAKLVEAVSEAGYAASLPA